MKMMIECENFCDALHREIVYVSCDFMDEANQLAEDIIEESIELVEVDF